MSKSKRGVADDALLSDENTESGTLSPRRKKRRASSGVDDATSNKAPREPADTTRGTNFYSWYDPGVHGHPEGLPKEKKIKIARYDSYPLYMILSVPDLVKQPPPSGCRLDDYTAGRLLVRNFEGPDRPWDLGDWWPVEFDGKQMIRPTRLPLGYAYKIWVSAGDKDTDGQTATKEQAGWYYGWWRGLHPLVGKEGLDANLYKIRPLGERVRTVLMGWYLHSRCVVQRPSGDPDDVTFAAELPAREGREGHVTSFSLRALEQLQAALASRTTWVTRI